MIDRLERRTLLKATAASLATWGFGIVPYADGNLLLGQTPDSLPPLNRFPRMMQEYLTGRVRDASQQGAKRRAALKTREDALAYVADVRQRIRQCFGDEPIRTPLNPRITGVVERDQYRIEKLIFESRPGFLVTANLYVPKGIETPVPGVVGTCGHSSNGKAAEPYQGFAQGLARQGYVVLIYDPIGQGERLQYVTDKRTSRIGTGVREHLYAGNQQFLVGEFLGAWRAWDGIRALDYLLTRKEVDASQVGVTGNSGGGTMTTWLCGVEQRWSMAAPSCFVTTFCHNMENELPADTEQCPPRALALGLGHADFLAALAPKPIVILGKERDFFDVRGTEEAYESLRRLYRLLDAEDKISLFCGPTAHGYSQENREAMYRWFNRITKASSAESEPELVIEEDETLWCTPHGQVAELDSRPIYTFTKQRSEQLRSKRQVLTDTALQQAVCEIVKVGQDQQAPDYRILRPIGGRKYPTRHATCYFLETEPGVGPLVTMLSPTQHLSRPPRLGNRAMLYVSHQSADEELRTNALIPELLAAVGDVPLFACDLRGSGESQPNTCGRDTYLQPYGSDYFYAIHNLMLDDPYPAQRARDVLAVVAWLNQYGYGHVHLVASGWGTVPATLAAVLEPKIERVTLQYALTSFSDLAESEDYVWPLSCLLPGILEQFDLPDCYRFLSQRNQLKQVSPCSPNVQPG